MTASASVQSLQSVYNTWQQERTSILDNLHTAHERAQQLDATQRSLDTFHSSLFAAERNALIEQIQQLSLDKLALKRQLSSRNRLYQPAASSSSASATHAGTDDIELRHDVDELRLTNQYVMALSQQKEAELTAMEQAVQRMKREKDRAEQKLLEAERREVRERERLAGMEEVLRQCRDRERQLLEEKLDLQRELLRRRREDAIGAPTAGRRTMSVGSVEEVEEDGIDSTRHDSRNRLADASHLRVLAADSGAVSDSGGEEDVFVESQEHSAAAAVAAGTAVQEGVQHWPM